MATKLPTSFLGLEYALAFTEAYQASDEPFEREVACEQVQFPACLIDPRPGDLLAGKRIYPEIGYSPQYGGLGYYFDPQAAEAAIQSREHSEAELAAWVDLRRFWEKEQTAARCWNSFSPTVKERLSEPWNPEEPLTHPAYPLYRMGGLVLDYEKLVQHGIPGLFSLIDHAESRGNESGRAGFFRACRASVSRVAQCLKHYATKTLEHSKDADQASKKLADSLRALEERPPETFHQALQLILLLQCMSGTINYGRLDTVLGPFLRRDLNQGTLTWDDALVLMRHFYQIINEQIVHFDGRIIIGGQGRENPEAADLFARLAMQTTASLNLPMPQLSLRFDSEQDPELLDTAYRIIGSGKTFPMLYNDAVNVPAVEQAFGVDRETAEQYVPYGCGETVIPHQSCDTPSAIINLQRCLESALNHGCCLATGERIGPDYGGLETHLDFEALWEAYSRTVDYYTEPLAEAQAQIYQTTGQHCPFSLISLLSDDCLDRGQAIFAGGLRILGGTNESYGNTNAADSLGAIRKLLYEERSTTAQALLTALSHDWQGQALLRKACKAAPKYGNDLEAADALLCRVHDQVCHATAQAGRQTALDHFLVVVINNNHNTLWGRATSASADGRSHGAPLAPGNAPGAGADQSGLTAVLNSQARPDPKVHGGAVQNARLSASFPKQHPLLYRALFDTYFKRGGTQAMISVTSREDLEAALERPEEYANLLVRVGGFSARFIDLDSDTQREILSRTEHGG